MATVGARHGRSSLRNGRFRGRHDSGEEVVRLDYSKEPKENVREILTHIVRQHGVSKSKKLAYLNAFVKFLYKVGSDKELPYSKDEIFCCLRVGLLHEAKEVRAAVLRTIRYLLSDQESLDYLFSLHIDYLIARSLDVCLDNEVERIHAVRLIRKISQLNPHKLTPSLLYPLIAIGNDGILERDRMAKVALASLCEIAFHNAEVVSQCAGISTILHNILDCHQYPRVNESLVATVLYLLNHPRTRHLVKINIDLEQLVAPFTDCHYKHTGSDSAEKSLSDDKESRFAASKMAIVTVMKSWPGMIRLCRPDGSGLQSLVGILYLPNAEIRKNIVDMAFDLFRLQSSEWTSDFSLALLSTDPSHMKDSWRLNEGFVADEGRALLTHLSATRPNLVENHQALILSAWINAGILEALVEVITTSDGCLFVRTVILLGELVHLASTILPADCNNHCHCLPSLMARASSLEVTPQVHHRASLAVNCLNRIHLLKRRGAVPSSLYLEQILSMSLQRGKREISKPLTFSKDKLEIYAFKVTTEEIMVQAIRDSLVLNMKEHDQWNWDLVIAILQWPDGRSRKLDEQTTVRFLRRMVSFYKPTSAQFTSVDQNAELARKISTAGSHLVDFLVNCEEDEAQKLLFDWLSDIAHVLSEISVCKIPNDAVLSLSNVNKTLSRDIFLLVGKCSTSIKGDKWLERSGVYQQLLELISMSCHETYTKLTTSSLNYARDGLSRVILSKALTASTDPGRLYSTKLLRVLLRANVPYFYHWGVELLVTQLYDRSRSVSMASLHVLEEACETKENLQSLVKMRPSFLHLGDKGVMMLCRLLSIPKGFEYLMDANYVTHELDKWYKSFNTKYVKIVEELLNEALTTYEKTYDGSYTRRSSSKRPKKNVYVPFHLYGQLVQHKEGFKLLQKQEYLKEYVTSVKFQELVTDEDSLKLKTALWALGHIGRSDLGVGWLQEENVIPTIIKLAEECGVFSIRGTAFYVLGLIATTRQGCQVLAQFGWESLWHTRSQRWPVLLDHDLLLHQGEEATPSALGEDQLSPSSDNTSVQATLAEELSSKLFFIEEEEKKDSSNTLSDVAELNSPGANLFSVRDITEQANDLTERCVNEAGDNIQTRTDPEDSINERISDICDTNFEKLEGQEKISSPTLSDIARRNARLRAQFFERVRTLPKSQTVPTDDGGVYKWATLPPKSRSTSLNFTFPKQRSTSESEQVGDPAFDGAMRTRKSESQPDSLQTSGHSNIKFSINPGLDTKNKESRESKNIATPKELLLLTTHAQHCESSKVVIVEDLSSDDGERKVKVMNTEKKTKMFEVTTYKTRPSSLREERSSSNESTATSKSRSDSFNTGSTTSGIGSCESAGPPATAEAPSLSPIASTASLTSLLNKQALGENKGFVHPSSTSRKMANLNRVPSLRRQNPNPALGMMSPTRGVESILDNPVAFTSSRDALGYATLRIIQRQRTHSSDLESDLGIGALYDEEDQRARSRSVGSWKSTGSDSLRSGIPKNASYVSVQDYESSGYSPYNTWNRLPPPAASKSPFGQAEFRGLCLPVDVTMVFQVNEGEDRRTASMSSTGSAGGHADSTPGSRVEHHKLPAMLPEDRDGRHETSTCIACHRCLSHIQDGTKIRIHVAEVDTDVSLEDADPCNIMGGLGTVLSPGGLMVKMIRSRAGSTNDPSSTAGSLTSTTDTDTTSKKMSEDSDVGKAIIRREIMRFITNLSSSVGTKGAEQGLLHLKRKFPNAFHDLCLYSDIAHILGSYSFRLNARRFIQELFDDLYPAKLMEEPRSVLTLTDELDVTRMATIRQDSIDDFADVFG